MPPPHILSSARAHTHTRTHNARGRVDYALAQPMSDSCMCMCRTWFAIDLLSVLPFDILGLVYNSSTIASLKVFRMVRLLRLLKLLRILRASRIIKRWEANLSFTYA